MKPAFFSSFSIFPFCFWCIFRAWFAQTLSKLILSFFVSSNYGNQIPSGVDVILNCPDGCVQEDGVKIFIILFKEMEFAVGLNSYYSKQALTKLHQNIKVQPFSLVADDSTVSE